MKTADVKGKCHVIVVMLVLYANMQTGQTIKVTLFVDRNMNQLLDGGGEKARNPLCTTQSP